MFAIPIIGQILQMFIKPVLDLFIKKEDTALGKYKVDGDVKISGTRADVETIQARAAVAIAFKDDLGVQLCRDLVLFPGSVGLGLYSYNWAFKGLIPAYTWEMGELPIILAGPVVAFLLVTAWRK